MDKVTLDLLVSECVEGFELLVNVKEEIENFEYTNDEIKWGETSRIDYLYEDLFDARSQSQSYYDEKYMSKMDFSFLEDERIRPYIETLIEEDSNFLDEFPIFTESKDNIKRLLNISPNFIDIVDNKELETHMTEILEEIEKEKKTSEIAEDLDI